MTTASAKIKDSAFTIKNKKEFRGDPTHDWQHRMKTNEHLLFLYVNNLLNVSKGQWAKKTVNGEVIYGHMYEGCEFIIRMKTKDERFNLTHNEDGAFDRHLKDNPGEDVVWSITSLNNGLESTAVISGTTAGLSALGIVITGLALTVALAQGLMAAEAEEFVASAVGEAIGVELDVLLPGIGIVLAILGFIGLWIVFALEKEIMVNLIYENRSATKAIKLVDHYVYNVGDSREPLPVTLDHLHGDDSGFFEFYDDVVVHVDNYSKFHGVGVSLKFQKPDGTFLIICIRNDIYKDANYTIKTYPASDTTSAQDAYTNCSGGLVTSDFPWGTDLVVKNAMDATDFNKYKFAGIISFNDAA